MAKKNYLRLDKISNSAHIESVVLADAELLAGQFVNLGKVVNTEQGEAVVATKATTKAKADAIVAPVYIDKGYADYDRLADSVKAGKVTRAIIFQKGDVVSINKENAMGIAENDNVTVGADGFGFAKAATGDVVVGKAIAIETERNVGELVVIRFDR